MRLEGQILGEDIGQLIMRIDVEYLSMVLFDEFANVMIPDVNMLGAPIMSRIDSKEYASVVVSAHWSRSGGIESGFSKE